MVAIKDIIGVAVFELPISKLKDYVRSHGAMLTIRRQYNQIFNAS
jgi:hypothetical protein